MSEGKAAVITGGAGAIAGAMARRLARDGTRIALLDHDPARLAEAGAALRETGCAVSTHVCDVTDSGACQVAVDAAAREHGGVDLLVLCAGLTQVSLFQETDVAVYRRTMDVNFFGAVHCVKAALPHLLARRGHIVVLSSIAGFAPLVARTGYCAGKHALHGFFDTLRAELAGTGVRVMLVCPSFTQTDFASRGLAGDGSTLRMERSVTGRVLTPDQVADAIHRGIRRNRRLVVIGTTGKIAWWVSRLFPRFYERGMRRRFTGKLWQERD